MNRQHLRLTTVGVPVRTELLVRSMLRVVNARTIDRWSFTDEADAHVAIQPMDAAGSAGAPAHEPGQPRYVLLTEEGRVALGKRPRLPKAFAASDLTMLLDSISGEVAPRTRRSVRQSEGMSASAASAGAAPATAPRPADPFRLGIMLQTLLGQASRDVFRIEIGGVVLFVIPAARALLVKEPIDEDTLRRILEARDEAGVTVVPDRQTQQLIAGGAKPQTIDWLLWRVGLDGPQDRLLSSLPPDARFALRRWPDFGRLKHDQAHLQMAARLTRLPLGIDELAASVGQPADRVRAFVNACSLCDLIEVHPAAVSTPVQKPATTARAPSGAKRYSSIFRSIRSALGFGAR